MKATIHLIVVTALRDRLLAGLFLLLAVTTALAIFLGGTALSEQLQSALVMAAGAGRVILVLGLTIFAAFHIQGLFETREVEAILARAISRGQFVVAYWLGLSLLAVIAAGVFVLVIAFIANFTAGSLIWGVTVVAECVIIVGVVTFAGLMLERATPTVMFTMGFYALARLMGFFVGIRDTVEDSSVSRIVRPMLDTVTLFVPRLDLFGQTRWIVYGFDNINGIFLIAQTAAFLAVVLTAAIFDLKRKQF